MTNSETAIWNDGAVNPDEILKTEINKKVAQILGYTCDELILTCKSGIQKCYFVPKLPVNTKLYVNHKFGNWYDYLSKAGSIPLKMVIENERFSFESVASEIKPMQLSQAFFELPADCKTMKSPY